MTSNKAPNVSGVESSGRRTVNSLCGMCAVRCPIQVEVEETLGHFLQAVEVGSPAMARRRVVAHLTALEGLLRKAFEVEAP